MGFFDPLYPVYFSLDSKISLKPKIAYVDQHLVEKISTF
jgi:hypothetical protein